MDPSQTFSQPRGACNSSEKSVMLQPAAKPPAYQDNPVGFPTSFPSHPAPQGPSAQGSYQGQSVVAVQPAVFVPTNPVPLANPAPEYTCYSIFTMLCCCLPLGIAALVYSLSTRIANYSGQRELAEKNSKTARTLNHVAVAIFISLVTRTANGTGQKREAARNSQIALILNHLAFVVGSIIIGAYFLDKYYLSEPTLYP